MVLKRIGLNIRALRDKRGLSQEELAGRAKVARRAVQQLESGDGNPTIGTLEAIAKVLACPVGHLLDGVNQFPQNTEAQSLNDAALLVQAFAASSPGQRALLLYTATGHERYLRQLEAIPALAQFAKTLKKVVSS